MLTTITLDGAKGGAMGSRIREALRELWRTDRPLTAVGLLMAAEMVSALALMLVDPRTIAGAPAWLKPAKFGASIAIYCLTLAWIFRSLPEWPRMRRLVSLTSSVIFFLEILIIDIQAWRGTTSHFNVSTPVNGALFALMGIGIIVQTLASAAVAVAVWRHRFEDEAMGWALRAGLTITIIGALSGGLMTRPTVAQISEARITHRMPVAGAHTVGAPDGGPGLPGTGWSLEHGDLRVPHFIGLHAVQALTFGALLMTRRRSRAVAVRMVQFASVSYLALFGGLLWQALRGESVVAPATATLAALAGWAVLTTVGLWGIHAAHARTRRSAMLLS